MKKKIYEPYPASMDDWTQAAIKQLGADRADRIHWETPEGIRLKPLYTSEDLKEVRFDDTLPGFEPFIRGPYPTMYLGRPWTVRQYSGYSTAEESNTFYKKILRTGGQGISVAFDLATHRGYDSDHPRVIGDVGKAGVAIDTVEDMKRLFEGIPLDGVSVSMTMSGAVLPVMAAFIVAAEESGVSPGQLKGTIQNDILKEFMVRNTYIYAPEHSMRIFSDMVSYMSRNAPNFNTVSISGYHLQEAGAPATLELAYTLANGREYVRLVMGAGMDIDEFAPRLSFFWGINLNFYMEIAKLRAARLLWARVMDEFNPSNPKSKMLRMHCQTSGWPLTEQDPYNNIVRTTIEAMAGVFGGTQSLHTNSFDEAIALPSDFSARIARNTQLILREETDICKVVDPWGGSYMMEKLTQDLADSAWKIMEEIEAAGGMSKFIESGLPKTRIEEFAAATQARIDSGLQTVVGLNKFRRGEAGENTTGERLEIDDYAVRKVQVERIRHVKSERDTGVVNSAQDSLTECAANGQGNLLALAVDAMRARATVGEVTSALEEVWGRHQARHRPVSGVYGWNYRKDERWEAVREEIAGFVEHNTREPSILLCKVGQDGHDRGVNVVATGLSDLGFTVRVASLFSTPAEIAERANKEQCDIVGISSLTAGHKILIPGVITELRERFNSQVPVVVGGVIPVGDYAFLRARGVAEIFGPGTPVPAVAQALLGLLQERDCMETVKNSAIPS